MKFAAIGDSDGHLIQGYEHDRILIDGQSYTRGLAISPERIVTGWGPAAAVDLTGEHFATLVELDPQVILVGTGGRQVFPDPHIYLSALRLGVGVEVMDTGAACRTYNILVAEGRKVAAGLIIG